MGARKPIMYQPQISFQPIQRLHKAMQIQNFKKNLMTKNNPYYKATKGIKKYAGVSEN